MSEPLSSSNAVQENGNPDIDIRFKTINGIYNLRIDIQKALLIVGSRQRLHKRVRTEANQQQLTRKFGRAVAALQREWYRLSDVFFRTTHDMGIYEKVAHDLVKAINKNRKELNVFDEHTRLLVGGIIKPIIAAIMDEEELNKSSRHRQERRKSFIEKLLQVQLDLSSTWFTQEELDHSNSDDSIDVCSFNPNMETTASSQAGADPHRTRATTSLPTNIAFRPISLECNFERILFLDFLFDALSRHSKTICKDAVDYSTHIYHIMNITYIVDILVIFFGNMYSELEEARARRMNLPIKECVKLILEALPRYETSIRENSDSLDMSPLIIFRKDLNKILSMLIMIKLELEK